MSTLVPYFEMAAKDENSPFVRSNDTCDRADELLNSMSMTGVQKPSKSKSKRVDKYITQVSVGNKKIYTGLRDMIPLTEVQMIVSYMGDNDTKLVDYAKAKHIGIPAGKEFFTPAVQRGVRYFRRLHGIVEDTKKLADVTIGWGCFVDNMPLSSFAKNAYTRLETTSHKFKRLMKQGRAKINDETAATIAAADVIGSLSIPKTKRKSRSKKSNVVSDKSRKSQGKAEAKRQVESIAKTKAKKSKILLSDDEESDPKSKRPVKFKVKKSRILLSDDEESEEEPDDTNDHKKTRRKSKRQVKSAKVKKSKVSIGDDDESTNNSGNDTETKSQLQEETSGTDMDDNPADSDHDVDMFGGSGEVDDVTRFMIQQEKKKPLKRKLGPKKRALPKRQKSNDKV
jgi:hypothetical protein